MLELRPDSVLQIMCSYNWTLCKVHRRLRAGCRVMCSLYCGAVQLFRTELHGLWSHSTVYIVCREHGCVQRMQRWLRNRWIAAASIVRGVWRGEVQHGRIVGVCGLHAGVGLCVVCGGYGSVQRVCGGVWDVSG